MSNQNRLGRELALLRRYLVDRRRMFLAYTLMILTFGVIISLYSLPMAAVFYGALLSLCIGLAACGIDLMLYRSKHIHLVQLQHSISLGLEGLPKADSLPESDYQALLEQLYQAQRTVASDSQKVLSDVSDYYTLWAHQIKVPLSALDLLVQTDSRDKQALQAELFRTQKYVEMALGYIRMESRSSDYVLRRCSLDEIIRRGLRSYARLFILSGVSLEYEGTDAQVMTDEKWLGFVLEQLLSNAVKYTPAGKVVLGVQGESLIIRDTGVGIEEGDLPRVFEKGFTGYNGRQERSATGLGLYLCKRVLDKLSHSIAIASQPGEGTTVTITFPKDDGIIE